jgi:hypothetical protein
MTRLPRRLTACATASFLMFSAASAGAASLLEENFYLSGPRYDGKLPPCEVPLRQIKEDFDVKEHRFWNSDLTIVKFEGVQEVAFRPWAPDTIPRRFCRAAALTSDGAWRPVHYSIGEDTGFVGATWGVEWCVDGVDRNWTFNPVCKMEKP